MFSEYIVLTLQTLSKHTLNVWCSIHAFNMHFITYDIYTPSVFCYDKHKKNFDIQFSLKRHETV